MPYTMQQVVDKGRYPLNDPNKVRYSDAALLGFANDAILLTRKKRPDLFLGAWAALPGNLAFGAAFPIPDEYVPLVADYISGRAELIDDEHANSGRAEKLVATFYEGLLT